ncbi:GFA family protein [Streptomyces sp. col6]|uniref:GFA family protein n=1 Tax=Streptomyces sp. col6 TaxID=2478958 RepID=UPI0011CEC750|nr:GFA family protein [Streptomyces sp. col6]TXS04858.1 GFA family protein [Streptomyces sp. col6]
MNTTPAGNDQQDGPSEVRTGGCLCGRVRFTTRGPAVFPHTCACGHCQKLGGAPVMWWVGFESVTWSGDTEPTWYETYEGEARRAFCPTCGSRLAAVDSDVPETGINVTALDDTSGPDLVPVHASFRDNAAPWLSPAAATDRDAQPTRPGDAS